MQAVKNSPYLSVVIPAYNEEARITDTLLHVVEYLDAQPYTFEVLVVDDGSTDNTLSAVQKFAETRPSVRVIHYKPNRGKGYAVRVGVLAAEGEYILFADADLATPIEELGAFWEHISAGVDVVIASRPLKESRLVQRQPFYREWAGRAFNHVVRIFAVRGIHDTQCGFKLFRRDVAREVFSRCTLEGFSFDIEVLHLAQRLGYLIVEAPVHWYHREGSKVKLLHDGLKMLVDIIRLRWRHRRLNRCSCNED